MNARDPNRLARPNRASDPDSVPVSGRRSLTNFSSCLASGLAEVSGVLGISETFGVSGFLGTSGVLGVSGFWNFWSLYDFAIDVSLDISVFR